jgi:hypothetical protein
MVIASSDATSPCQPVAVWIDSITLGGGWPHSGQSDSGDNPVRGYPQASQQISRYGDLR